MLRATAISLSLSLFCLAAIAQTHQHGSQPSGDGRFNPFVAPDGRGGFYLAYVERANGKSDVMLGHSADGETFSDPARVNNIPSDATVRNENPPKVAVAPDGAVYVCWANERAKWKGNIRFARSTDGGKTFSDAMSINSDADREPAGHAFQSITVDRKGRVYVAWIDERNKKEGDRGAEIWMSVSEDGGRTFSRDRRVIKDVCECCRTNIQIDPSGRLFLAYRTVPASGPMYRDIIVARSDDRGRSFTPVKVSDDRWAIDACPVTGPGLSIDSRGAISVVWFTGGDGQGLYYATSADHGRSYGRRRQLDPAASLGKHAQIVALPDGRGLVAWDEKSDKVSIVMAVLDLRKGALQKRLTRRDASYPVMAVGDKRIILAGMRNGPEGLLLESEFLSDIP